MLHLKVVHSFNDHDDDKDDDEKGLWLFPFQSDTLQRLL